MMPGLIALLTFVLSVFLVYRFRPGQALVRTYVRVDHRLKEVNRGFFQYDRTNRFLMSHGAASHYGSGMTPLKYMILRVVCAAACFLIGSWLGAFGAVAAMLLGFWLPSLLLIRLDQQDNLKMTPQLQALYNALQEQIKAGVYVTDALAECYRGIEKGRLRTALEGLSGEIMLGRPFGEAMQHFNDCFNNGTIDSLCVILVQAQVSGQSVELLGDMAEQIKDMQAAALLRKKEQLNRRETFCIFGILSVIIAILLYACISTMMRSASSF